jgi:hypothetical protein
MTGIQAFLIGGVIVIFIYFISRFRSAFFDLLVLLLFSTTAIFFILFPEYTNVIAHKMGVSRGADLLFYVCILFFLFIIIKLFARIRRLEKKLTEMVRQLAKDKVQMTEEFKKNEE